MNITWLGHSGFRIEIEDQVLLVDPWMTGNPVFPAERRPEAIAGASAIVLTHGHGDHAGDALAVARETGAPIAAIHEIAQLWGGEAGVKLIGFGKGGTLRFGAVAVTMVNAQHSSSLDVGSGAPVYAGDPAGFMIRGEGHVIYVSGDTDVMADMAWMGQYHAPDIGILCCGGHYTMDQRAAAWAANRYFDFKTVIPCHYKTFGLLAQDAEVLKAELKKGRVIEPVVMEAITP